MCVYCDTTEHENLVKEDPRTLSMMHVVTRHKLYDGAAGTVYLKRETNAKKQTSTRT